MVAGESLALLVSTLVEQARFAVLAPSGHGLVLLVVGLFFLASFCFCCGCCFGLAVQPVGRWFFRRVVRAAFLELALAGPRRGVGAAEAALRLA